MLAVLPQSVADAIVTIFSEARELRADDLHREISKRFFRCSTRAVYKELRNLVAQGIVVKVRDYYSLSITWTLNLIQFAERCYSTSVASLPKVSKLPAEGEKVRWKFNDLQHLDRFWIQMMFLMFEHSRTRKMFVWAPCFWFDVIHYHKDLEAQEAMKIAGNKMYMIIGGRTFLDKLPSKYWSTQVYEWSYAVSPFEAQRTVHFDVIDDLVLTIKIDATTTTRIEDLFNRIRSKSDLGLLREFEEIKGDARATMTLERAARKAERLRRKCCEFFGVADPFHLKE